MSTAYAEKTDVAEFLGIEVSALPADIERLIARASRLVDRMTLGRIDLTIAEHVAAASEAVCAQVEYWGENNEETEFEGAVRSRAAGKVTTIYAGDGNPRLAPRAYDALLAAGLLYTGVG